MNFSIKDFLTISEKNPEERELLSLSSLAKDLSLQINYLNLNQATNFYDELTAKIRSLIYNYIPQQESNICNPVQRYLFLLYDLFKKLSNVSFMNKKFLLNFLYKRIIQFYNPLISQDMNNTIIINDVLMNLCKDRIKPIVHYCLNYIVNKFIFDEKNKLYELNYLLKFFQENERFVEISKIKKKISEIFFVQLICLDDFSKDKIKNSLKEENNVKEFITNKIDEFYQLNLQIDNNTNNENINKNLYDEGNNHEKDEILFLFKNDFNMSSFHLIRYLRKAIINVFTPVDANILDYFEIHINKYLDNTNNIYNNQNSKEVDIKLDILGKLFLNNNIQDVDTKIRNISFLIDIILQKYFDIQNIPELDLLKFPRINILMNRLFIEKSNYSESNKKELINAIFEHFIISQFIYNYLKYQIKDPEHYPIEIRYFVIYSYIKISESYLITNPFSSYITSITFREIINYLKLEKGFQKQKYIKNDSNLNNANESNNNNVNLLIKKSSEKKSKRRKSTSRSKKHKKRNKKKSVQKVQNVEEKINYNIDINLLENYSKLENDTNSQSKLNKSNNEEKLDQPQKIISKTLFNYLCFIYSMQKKYQDFSEYFGELYSFIDNYIEENIKSISLDDDWTWLFIYSIKFIKNFDLRKTFEKFEVKSEKNNIETNIKLIAHLSKKVKYCNTQEHFLILDVIYNILINTNNLQNILKAPKFSDKFKKLNRALSYLSFNINYSVNSTKEMSLINPEVVADKLFKITNLLFIESLDEYFWIPKSLKGYKNFNDFATILESVFDKILYKKSLYSELFLYGLVSLKKYINRFIPKNNQSKKEKEREQYILCLDYFCKFKIPEINSIQDLRKSTMMKENIVSLMELMPDEYDLKYDMNEKVDLLKNLLLSGEYDLRICLFLICQLITNKKLEENSEEIRLINSIFKLMINKKYKFLINFLLTIYKSIEKYLYDLINEYVQLNFPENYNFSKKEYNKFLDFFNSEKPVDANNQAGRDIQIIYHNWRLIRNQLEKSEVFYSFLVNAEELNYPKSVMNLIEKYIYDITREKNIHNFSQINIQDEDDDNLRKIFKRYLKLYYKAYSHIDDNKIILDNFFNNNEVLSFLGKNSNNQNKNINLILVDNSTVPFNEITNSVNNFLITLDANILLDVYSIVKKIHVSKNMDYAFVKIIKFLYNIYSLNEKNNDNERRRLIFTLLKRMEKNAILQILGYNNKLNQTYNSMNYSLWLYELTLYLEQFELFFSQCKTNYDFINNRSLLSKKLRNLFINKRKIPHVKRFLLVFEFRRFIFNLYEDKISELYCLMDICKVYKSIYQTGISKEEFNDFRDFLKIFIDNLIQIDSDTLINIDKKLFLVPLKYYVKFFSDDNSIKFEEAYTKYQNLYIKNKNSDFLSYKIIILREKLKAKTGVVGINDVLLNKIKKLGNKNSHNNQEGLVLYTDFYLDQLLTNESDFNCIKPREQIKSIQIYDINDSIFNYLEGAINICIITEKEKYLRKYMPEIINLFFKVNLAIENYSSGNNINRNISQIESQTIMDENINKYKYLLNKFKKEVNINKLKIIIPQLIICYQYLDTDLYNFAIELLASYAQQNIDLISFLLSSFLNFKIEDMKNIGIKPSYRNDSHLNNKYQYYLTTLGKSKKFVNLIKHQLNQKNQHILTGYEEFCSNLCVLFFESKKKSNMSKREIKQYQINFINNVNKTLANYDIILPTLENINRYKSSLRNNPNSDPNSMNNVLFLKELDSKIEILSSKEKPMHIRFKTRNITGNISPNKYYDFLLKCDVNDITKEIKTFEIIDEINNIFKMKHYDTNEEMSLKRYLIVPIAPTIILAEWLNNCISFSSVIEEQSKKDLIYQDEYKTIINNDTNKPFIIPGSIINEEEKFNILYNYYQYNFFNPNLWYNAKKKYIISSAIWSMTQFLVGLGDRHPGNIMFNKKDGEVVHIDFGYVALKGLSLGVPEIVEFRLTFNLKKNLGLFEENGLFNYICVKVLKTFKEYYKTLSARIEYYQFDPLFDSENDNKTFKLFDQNDMFFKYLDDNNVKFKLKELIVKNTNPENLEKMYIWWSPWV